ncbi:hypothetical protein [Nostoc sphaeroides]|uniref:Uncharacterized protein n=1 Tax=Nostoc sphaeroides CCNUC1 TaxID=2653204 RepID=A0A5P8W5W4_9NOSO|nr:hypothetical protein [Nostoc sphaeroides]QFS48040.1 hypothetical protein GXM_05532 [Nostoc sphaeroides CCNUC1]
MTSNLRKIRAVLRNRFSKGIAINNPELPKLFQLSEVFDTCKKPDDWRCDPTRSINHEAIW